MEAAIADIETLLSSSKSSPSKPTLSTLELAHVRLRSLLTDADTPEMRQARTLLRRLGVDIVSLGGGPKSLSCLVVTWNVGNAPPRADELELLVPTGTSGPEYDIVVVGLQECEYELTPAMVTMTNDFIKRKRRDKKTFTDGDPDEEETASNPSPPMTEHSKFVTPHNNNKPTAPTTTSSSTVPTPSSINNAEMLLRLENTAKRAITSRAGAYFAALLHEHLGLDTFVFVRDCELVQMRLFMFCKLELRPYITNVAYASKATGMGHMPNKGGVAITMDVLDTRLCFISAHLPAHRPARFIATRNTSASDILKMVQHKLKTTDASFTSDFDHTFFFGDLNYRLDGIIGDDSPPVDDINTATLPNGDSPARTPLLTRNGGKLPSETTSSDSIMSSLPPHMRRLSATAGDQHADGSNASGGGGGVRDDSIDYVFDDDTPMPYRGDSTPDEHVRKGADHLPAERAIILEMIANKNYDGLLRFDQLKRQQNLGTAFVGFIEAPSFPFPPTFKVERELGYKYNPKRLPAYADRIMWNSSPAHRRAASLKQQSIWCPDAVTSSDHKPVCSVFLLDLTCTTATTITAITKETTATLPQQMTTTKSRFNLKHLSTKGARKSSIPLEGMQVVVRLLQAEQLTAMDPNGLADPYVLIYSTQLWTAGRDPGADPMAGATRTKVKFKTLEPSWDEKLVARFSPKFSTPESLLGKHLTLAIWDYDMLTRDDFIGEVVLCLDDAVNALMNQTSLVSFDINVPAEESMGKISTMASNGDESNRSLSGHNIALQHSKSSKRNHLRPLHGEVLFNLPLLSNGRKHGMISGLIRLAMPGEKIEYGGGIAGGFSKCWKCNAVLE